jgi:hypothetical protein
MCDAGKKLLQSCGTYLLVQNATYVIVVHKSRTTFLRQQVFCTIFCFEPKVTPWCLLALKTTFYPLMCLCIIAHQLLIVLMVFRLAWLKVEVLHFEIRPLVKVRD